MVAWARERGTVLASDECYIEQGWDVVPVSVLHPEVSGGAHDGLLAVHSLSKRSNMAGYRAGFVTGDPGLIAELHEIRRHAGMIVPAPVQAAMVAALDDDAHAEEQRERYRSRRIVLRAALEAAGWVIENSEAGLYLWASRARSDGWDSARILAGAGILVSPGRAVRGRGSGVHPGGLDRHRRARRHRGRPPHHPRVAVPVPRVPPRLARRARPRPRLVLGDGQEDRDLAAVAGEQLAGEQAAGRAGGP